MIVNLNNMNIVDEINEQEIYNYSKIIRPTTMRSTYWKFFGFPADEFGLIITRRSVICSICGIALSYNKNTSNLKSHLRSKHPEQMSITCSPSPHKKAKFNYVPTSNNDVKQVYSIKQQPSESNDANQDDLIEILAEDMDGDDYQEMTDDYQIHQIEYLTTDDANNFDDEPTILKPTSSVSLQSHKRKNPTTVNTLTSSIVSMIIEDLWPIMMCEGTGFINFVATLSGSRTQVPNSKSIENHIERLHRTEFVRLTQNVEAVLGDRYFSLGFEKWKNCENSTFITTHINYVVDDEQVQTVILNVVDPSSVVDWNTHLSMLKMKNCSACVVDFDIDGEETLKSFLGSHHVPVIPCFLTTIAQAAEKCFANNSAQEILMKAKNVFNEHSRFVTDVSDPPKINNNFWITTMNFIEFIYEFLINNSERIENDTTQLIIDIKTLIDCLTPLKLTLDTLSEEQHTLSSLIRPLTSQLINSHFILDEDVSELQNELNMIIHKGLEDSQTLSSSFLMQSTFMDPRFQSLQNPEDIQVIKTALKKFCDADPAEAEDTLLLKKEKEITKRSPLAKNKSAGLKFFFGNKEQKLTPNKAVDRFDLEFNNYNTNADAGLDQLVLTWWKESALLYPNLKKLANRFNCVLLSVQKCNANLNERIAFYDKRYMCNGNTVDSLVWLHQNRINI